MVGVKGLLLELTCDNQVTLGTDRGGQVSHSHERVGVLWAERAFAGVNDLFLELTGIG